MKQNMIDNCPTLKEFVEERERLNDCKEGIKVLDAPHLNLFILGWR